jgi:hypothetical protein
MQIFYLIISLIFVSGFYYLGNKIVNIFKLESAVNSISDPAYQYTSIGIALLIFIFYPIFFLGFFKFVPFSIISLIIVVVGLLNLFKNYRSIINSFYFICSSRKNNIYSFLVFALIILYFLLSISPITSGDSVSYHMGAAKYILRYGQFSPDLFSVESALVGANEFLNTLALSIKAYQFTSLKNFIGIISIVGIIKKFSARSALDNDSKNLLLLCILSTPVLVFLITSSKSQLFSTSLIFFCYALLVYCLNFNKNTIFLTKASYLLIALPIVAIQTKISFSISFFIIIATFFFIFNKKIKIRNFVFLLLLLCAIGLLPPILWKQSITNYPFYNYIFNPFPLNIPGFDMAYQTVKGYNEDKFPLILLLPLELSDLTQFIGLGLLTIFFIFKYKYQNKKILIIIILFFLFICSLFGQKTPRFYLEIYFLLILVFSFVVKDIARKILFKILKFGIITQTMLVISICLFGVVTLLPGIFSDNLHKKTLSKYASGYNLYNWLNSVLPEDSTALISHRAYYFAEKNIIYFGMSSYLNKTNIDYHLKKIKEKEPQFIIFYGNHKNNFNYDRLNFKDCTKGLFKKKDNVGYHETRNPFNTGNYYNAYIYNLDSSILDYCVKFN